MYFFCSHYFDTDIVVSLHQLATGEPIREWFLEGELGKELIGDTRYDTAEARLQHEAEVNEIVTEWTRQRTKHDAMAQLSGVGVP